MTFQGIVQHVKNALTTTHASSTDTDRLIDAFLDQTKNERYYEVQPKKFVAGREILNAEPRRQIDTLLRMNERQMAEFQASGRTNYRLLKLETMLMRRTLPFSADDVARLLKTSAPSDDLKVFPSYLYPIGSGLAKIVREYLAAGAELTLAMRAALEKMRVKTAQFQNAEWRKITSAFDELLGNTTAGLPDPGTAWTDAALAVLDIMSAPERATWTALFTHAATADGSKPSAKWLTASEASRAAISQDEFARRVTDWMNNVAPPPPFSEAAPQMPRRNDATEWREFVKSPEYQEFLQANGLYHLRLQEYLSRISEKNIAILKGLAWYAADMPSAELARALGHMAETAFQSIRERGAWAKTAGNAAIWALGQMPNGVGVGPLARLRTKLRDRSALKLIASSMEQAAAKSGMTVDELEDLAVPTGGLNVEGIRQETFGEQGAATLTLNAKTNLQWFGPDGKPRKAVPASVKREFAADVKALKAAEEEIRQALGAQSARLDCALTDERTWPLPVWRERYLSHPILSNLTRRLIWTFDGQPGLPVGDSITDGDGVALPDVPETATVKLWHPLGADVRDVLRWRDALEGRGITQPFKQAHREVYLLTDAERATRTYSNRFAAHILKQHQFNSLCVLRGWKNSLRLMVDDSYPPATKELPRHGLRAEFWVEGIGEDYGTDTNETGTYLRLAADQVRFYPLAAPTNYAHACGGGDAANHLQTPAEAVSLDQVPALAFSEIMRDVDLFVGVASLGNDPNWADGGPQGRFRAYWQDYAFGDLNASAKTRADVLTRLLPRLKIAGRTKLDGRFLVVRGDLRTYKIHLGSGNILMEPNDQYLCIVPKAGAEDGAGGLFLPFEGDRTLSVILSKAFLLADDSRITDPSITRQIR